MKAKSSETENFDDKHCSQSFKLKDVLKTRIAPEPSHSLW